MFVALTNPVEVRGRIRKPTVQITASQGVVRIRLDSDVDPAFWAELDLSRETLVELLAKIDATEES
jgi:hypothetical protein